MKGLFIQSNPQDRDYRAALILGIAVGFASIFVKWGTGNLFPPFGPATAAAPPIAIMRHWGFDGAMYHWVGKKVPWGALLHGSMAFMIFIPYAFLAEKFPKITLWRGVAFGIFADIFLHGIIVPLMTTMPSIFGMDSGVNPWNLPWQSNFGELYSHIMTYWICEEMRRGMRFTITGKKDVL